MHVLPAKDTHFLPSKAKFLKGKTLFITGSSRGIGRSIGLRAALDGANVAIVAKTAEPDPRIPGTIYSVAEEIRQLGGRALPIKCDIRDENQVREAIEKTVAEFGGLDIVVNNASAISLTNTFDTAMKKYDLMHDINVRGTFCVSKLALPHLLKSSNPHILMLSPPISLESRWFAPHCAYTTSKFGMSMVAQGLAAELKLQVAVNALWPRTIIATAALQAFAGNQLQTLTSKARPPNIVADAAYAILCQPSNMFTGIFAIDENVLRAQGFCDFARYSDLPATELACGNPFSLVMLFDVYRFIRR